MNLRNPLPSWPEYPQGTPQFAISQRFGENRDIYFPRYGWEGHNGIDIAAPKATPVVAMHDGWIVECTSRDTGYGLRITQYFEDEFGYDITYGHFLTTVYGDISWNINRRDYPVKAGSIIGYVDSTGFSSGHHLHVTLRQWKNGLLLNQDNGFGGAIDPYPYISNMSNVIFVHKINTQEYGLLEITALSTIYHRAVDDEHLRKMAQGSNFSLPKNTDSSVDYTKAKDISY